MIRKILTAILLVGLGIDAQALVLHTRVAQGEISGIEHEGAALYKRIPYAEPPVGSLRWKAPVAKKVGRVSTDPMSGATVHRSRWIRTRAVPGCR